MAQHSLHLHDFEEELQKTGRQSIQAG